MRITGIFFVALLFVLSCRQSCKEKIRHLYASHHDVFRVEKKVNMFSLQLSYIPASLLTSDQEDIITTKPDSAHYYFKLDVVCPENRDRGILNNFHLPYELHRLFASGIEEPYVNPVLVKPGVKDGGKTYEYLLMFNKKDFNAGRGMTIVFFDRLFTNTKQLFEFDRAKIDEIETLQCYANRN